MTSQPRRPVRQVRRRSAAPIWRSVLSVITAPLWFVLAWTTTTLYRHRGDPTVWLIVIIVIELVLWLGLRLLERSL